MRAVIPFKKYNAKSRLSEILSIKEREELSFAMLKDVVNTLVDSECFDVIDILSPSIIHIENTNIVLTEKGLNESINEYFKKMYSHSINEPVFIIMADIPLVTVKNIHDITSSLSDIVIAPGRMGGTNALFIKDVSKFHVDYYGISFLKHYNIAIENKLKIEIFDSFYVSTDIDEISDLSEIIIHGKGDSAKYLKSIGFDIDRIKSRIKIKRFN